MKFTFVALVAALGVPGLAYAADPPRTEEFIEIIRSNGCHLVASEDEHLFSAFSGDEARAIVGALEDKGVLEMRGPNMTLKMPGCPGYAEAQNEADRLAALIRENGCVMSEEVAREVLPANGFTKDGVEEIVEVWLADGTAELDDKIKGLVLRAKGCE